MPVLRPHTAKVLMLGAHMVKELMLRAHTGKELIRVTASIVHTQTGRPPRALRRHQRHL